jgi:enamine deaminase RidA (YjgF/YER057c/UK114 family)
MKSYRKWKDDQERLAQERNHEAALRWRQTAFAAMGGRGRMGAAPEHKSPVENTPNVATPAMGAQAVRVGRTVYVTTQLPLDGHGAVVDPAEFRAQVDRAFANVTAGLGTAGVLPRDVVALTIYVVDLTPTRVGIVHDAAAAYLNGIAPVATVLGVSSLGVEKALVGVAATAVGGSGAVEESTR